jgi:two-component system, OmpR family, alkaline phosphatase synthesis response regulator PhoP
MIESGVTNHALVVAHKFDIRSQAELELPVEGYIVHVERSSASALAFLQQHAASLVVIEHPLGEESGIVLYRQVKDSLRKLGMSSTPVFVYVGPEHHAEIVTSLESGVDDYIRYPASFGVLSSRVRLIKAGPDSPSNRGRIHRGSIMIDLGRHEVFCGSREIQLSVMELFVLTVLLRDPGRVWSRADILREKFGGHPTTTERSVDVHIRALRNKLGECGNIIETVRGVGYRALDDLVESPRA